MLPCCLIRCRTNSPRRGAWKWELPSATPPEMVVCVFSRVTFECAAMTNKLRIGVVGVGHIGSNHARLYAEIPSAEFSAVFDVDGITNRTIATKFHATPAKSLDEFSGMIDAASVA